MPDDRFLHKRLCQSSKVAKLTDLEFRVWTTYVLIADDYGVMRMSAAALRSGNDAFEHKPARTLDRCLERLVDVGLVRKFQHQGRAYVFQHDWQEFQHVTRPRASVHPVPPLEAIEGCAPETREFLRRRADFSRDSLGIPDLDAEDKQRPKTRLRARDRLEADGDRQSAIGTDTIRDRFDRFWEHYPRKVGRGAAWRVWERLKPDEALLVAMLTALAWQRQQAQWVKDGGQFVPHPQTYLNQQRWLDSPPEDDGGGLQFSQKNTNSFKAIYGTHSKH